MPRLSIVGQSSLTQTFSNTFLKAGWFLLPLWEYFSMRDCLMSIFLVGMFIFGAEKSQWDWKTGTTSPDGLDLSVLSTFSQSRQVRSHQTLTCL